MRRTLLLAAAAILLAAGCAQETGKNTVTQAPNQSQRSIDRGPQVTLNFYNATGGDTVTPASSTGGRAMPVPLNGGVPQTQPSSQPAGMVLAGVTGNSQNIRQITITLGDTAGGGQNSTPTATGGPLNTAATQQPQTQVNPSAAFGMPGSAVTANASGTAGFGPGPVTGAPLNGSPNQQPTTITIRTAAQQIQAALQALQSLLAGVPASQPQ